MFSSPFVTTTDTTLPSWASNRCNGRKCFVYVVHMRPDREQKGVVLRCHCCHWPTPSYTRVTSSDDGVFALCNQDTVRVAHALHWQHQLRTNTSVRSVLLFQHKLSYRSSRTLSGYGCRSKPSLAKEGLQVLVVELVAYSPRKNVYHARHNERSARRREAFRTNFSHSGEGLLRKKRKQPGDT